MITFISKEGSKFEFNRDLLMKTCKYFDKGDKLQQDDENYNFKEYSSETIKSFKIFIKKGRKKKVVMTDDLETFADYLGCDSLKNEFTFYKEIEVLFPFITNVMSLICIGLLDTSTANTLLLLNDETNSLFSNTFYSVYKRLKKKKNIDEVKKTMIPFFKSILSYANTFQNNKYDEFSKILYTNSRQTDKQILDLINVYAKIFNREIKGIEAFKQICLIFKDDENIMKGTNNNELNTLLEFIYIEYIENK